MRPAGARSNPASLSREILAIVKITCSSQFQLKRGELLEDALQDPLRRGGLTALLQQVGAHPCMDRLLCNLLDCLTVRTPISALNLFSAVTSTLLLGVATAHT